MKIIELRRHSKRVKPSPHLTQDGVELARKVGAQSDNQLREIIDSAL